MKRTGLILLLFFSIVACTRTADKHEITKLKYNNPGLLVDLGVGLWAWPLPIDYDNDGDLDLVVVSPGTPSNGTYFFENKSDGKEKMPVFGVPERIGPGKKNLQISYIDGKPRVLSRSTEYRNFKEQLFQDPQVLFPEDSLEAAQKKWRFSQWKYVDYDNDGDLDLIAGIDSWDDYGWDNAFDDKGNWTNGPLHGYVYLLENENGSYVNKGKIHANGQPLDVYGAPTPNMEDFDGDGDLDLICGEFLDQLTWFENIGSREQPRFAKGRYLKNDRGFIKMDLEMIIPVAVDWDKDGDIDLIVGDEDGRVAFIENMGEISKNMPVFKSPRYFKQEAEYVKFGALSTPYSVDWDNDGDQDIITGNTAGYIGFIENLDGGNPPKWGSPKRLQADRKAIRIMAGKNGSIQGPAEAKWGYTSLSVADWDHDGLKDIIANSIWGKVVYFKNVGTQTEPKLSFAQPVKLEWDGDMPPKPQWNWWDPEENNLVTEWRTTPYTIDWNKDGLMDLVMLDQEGYLTYFERFKNSAGKLILKSGIKIFYGINYSGFNARNDVTDSTAGHLRLNTEKFGSSGRRKFTMADWDQDGDLDLLVNSKNTSLFDNTRVENGNVYFTSEGPLTNVKLAGHTTSPTIVNWDKDNRPDLIIGAEDGYFYYLKNSGQ